MRRDALPRALLAVLVVWLPAALAAWPAPRPSTAGALSPGGDWPQWRGPERSGLSRETGLLQSWPPSGPRLLWRAAGCGVGYSTPSVAGNRVYGMGNRGSSEVVWARDAGTGREVWSTPIAPAARVDRGDGPRSTPTVDRDRLFALGAGGELVCLDLSGRLLWRRSLTRDFGGSVPHWGYSESPLVDGEKVIATPGGRSATLVALQRATGQVVWRSPVPGGDGAQYASSIAADAGGQRQYIQFLAGGVVGVSAADGRFLWRWSSPANRTANCATPIYRSGLLFAASAYGTGGGLARLTPAGVSELYFTRKMKNHHGGMVAIGEYLYGFDDAILTCMEFRTGRVRWEDRSVGKGSLLYADGHLYVRSESGRVALVAATPQAYSERGRFLPPDRSGQPAWPHPVVAGGRLYLRDQDTLLCYDVKGP